MANVTMSQSRDNAGGPIAIRGYLVQTLVALLDIAQADPPFSEITLEPAHADEQFDFVWNNAYGAFAVQVKSTVNEFQKSAVEDWAAKLQAARKHEKCRLMLVGNYHTSLAKVETIGGVEIEKKNLDLPGLFDQAAHRIAKFIHAQGLDAGTPDEHELIAESLVTRLLRNSVSREPLGRDAFIKLLAGWIREAPRGKLHVDFDHFNVFKYAPENLIGREAETGWLDDAWNKAVNGEANRPRVLTFVAMGGEGKTSLVAKWAAELSGKDWPGCEAVFAWSFYSQGISESASSDLFLKEALVFFGDEEMANSARHVAEKGKRLAQLVGAKRSLLILDGVEPLQYAPTAAMPGELKDYGISALLKTLAANSRGLCVVTTRYPIPDLKAFRQRSAPEIELKHLSKEAGVELLESLGVKGAQREYEQLVEDVKGHALTLNLLGTYLRDAHAGDIRKRDQVKLEEADAEEQGGHAFRVMDAYVQWLSADSGNIEENKKAQRALAILQLMGLFDRPATADCIHALLKAPAIKGLTELLVEKNDAKRNMALSRLETAKLISASHDASGALVSLDAHPLLREYFAKRLREQQPAAWREAHRRIYKQLITTKEGDKPTLEQLLPLYQAVVHGCLAGEPKKACNEIYRDRILRGNQTYSLHKLGAAASDLGGLASFFERPWRLFLPGLSENAQAFLLNSAAFYLSALGRPAEALEPMQYGLEMAIEQNDWDNAATGAANLSLLELLLGRVEQALANAEQMTAHADRSKDEFQIMVALAANAYALHQAGHPVEAVKLFEDAERMQAQRHPLSPYLNSLQGVMYCGALLAKTEREAWRVQCSAIPLHQVDLLSFSSLSELAVRAEQMLKVAEINEVRIAIALARLTQGRIVLYSNVFGMDADDVAETIEAAMGELRYASQMDHLPDGLLTRSWLRVRQGDLNGAHADLDDAWEIAERGPMPLYQADILMHRSRLFFREAEYPWRNDDGPPRTAKDDIAEARRLIEKHGYWRRKEELEDAEAVIGKLA
ncbi:MAG: NB-ARC domain-containing protein [Gallionella sp.]|nr:NB-ARC domain-containing protein [Gallionella sp.]